MLQPRRRARRPAGATVGVVLVGAACLGVAVGLYQAAGPPTVVEPEAAIEWNAVAAIPKAVADASDAEWEARAVDEPSEGPSTSSGRAEGTRVLFSNCKWGGGTNCVVDGDTF